LTWLERALLVEHARAAERVELEDVLEILVGADDRTLDRDAIWN
jgi:hypothetical protein